MKVEAVRALRVDPGSHEPVRDEGAGARQPYRERIAR